MDRHRLASHPRQKILVSKFQTLTQSDLRTPPQALHSPHIHEFARRSIWLAGVECNLSTITNHLTYRCGKVANGKVLTGDDIDMRKHRLGILSIGCDIKLHDV